MLYAVLCDIGKAVMVEECLTLSSFMCYGKQHDSWEDGLCVSELTGELNGIDTMSPNFELIKDPPYLALTKKVEGVKSEHKKITKPIEQA